VRLHSNDDFRSHTVIIRQRSAEKFKTSTCSSTIRMRRARVSKRSGARVRPEAACHAGGGLRGNPMIVLVHIGTLMIKSEECLKRLEQMRSPLCGICERAVYPDYTRTKRRGATTQMRRTPPDTSRWRVSACRTRKTTRRRLFRTYVSCISIRACMCFEAQQAWQHMRTLSFSGRQGSGIP
jgi:hypothetical protein